MIKHPMHISHLTNIPAANVLVKGDCDKKHPMHISETQYTVIVTPSLGGKHSNVAITVAANAFTDIAGNANVPSCQCLG
jgi:hypothetical protein